MVETQIKFVVVGHHTRRLQAEQLALLLSGHLLIDEGQHGANWNHRRAIAWASEQSCRVVIVEDDALPVAEFIRVVPQWLTRFPEDMVSFYLGTGRPPHYQLEIASKLIDADKRQADYITINRLIHGVCYSVPAHKLQQVLSRWNCGSPADYAVSDASGGAVIYPCYSLVDHADESPVEQHPDSTPRTERRRAWRLHA
ncbi:MULTISPECIES: hypothetical protein [Pantoea]|uniref:hypothetical protein n=1 Tax=Pantoea TaxID=53335 RepID=UPI0039C8DF6C